MADYRAVMAVCEGVLQLLRLHYTPETFDNELEFKVFLAKDFSGQMFAGVSLFLYRIFPNGTPRTPSGRPGPDGRRRRTQLPLDLHFLLTPWAREASLQHTIAGWMMRVLEDNPILPAGLLNTVTPGVFQSEETVEIGLAELRTEDLVRIWDTLGQNVYQLSVPYLIRNIRIESTQEMVEAEPVQERRVIYIPR